MPTRERVNAFVAAVRAGRYVEAIHDFYAPEASMQENQQPSRTGRDRLIADEKAMLALIGRMETLSAAPVMVDGDHVAIGWTFQMTGADGQARRLEELALQRWRDDRIVEERFFYDPAQFAAVISATT